MVRISILLMPIIHWILWKLQIKCSAIGIFISRMSARIMILAVSARIGMMTTRTAEISAIKEVEVTEEIISVEIITTEMVAAEIVPSRAIRSSHTIGQIVF